MNSKSKNLQRVGYWWSEKKDKKINIQLCTQICKKKGLELVKIDLEKPLDEQGPFVAIVQKLCDVIIKAESGDPKYQVMWQAFQEYTKNHPEVVIIDSLESMKKLLDRSRQYKLIVSELQKEGCAFIPAFVELTTNYVNSNIAKMKAAGVTFPCVCKPLQAHGSLAHKMCIVFNENGLKDISAPCVMQKFINHNAVLYKLLLIGNQYYIIERPSLKNFYPGDHETIFFHSHDISKPNSASVLNELDESEPKTSTILPEKEKLDSIMKVLYKVFGLTLFGVDIIIDHMTGRHAIIDMNVFPGYEEVDNFYELLSDLIIDQISAESKQTSCVPVSNDSGLFAASEMHFHCQGMMLKTVKRELSSYSCFCCPISGTCNDALHCRPLNFNKELSDTFQLFNKDKMAGICSPEDSGIETSDSCDEKKKATVLKTSKKLHCRNHVLSQEAEFQSDVVI